MPNVYGDGWPRAIDDGLLVPALVSSRIGTAHCAVAITVRTYETGFRACSER
jgi:hypothetical protein